MIVNFLWISLGASIVGITLAISSLLVIFKIIEIYDTYKRRKKLKTSGC